MLDKKQRSGAEGHPIKVQGGIEGGDHCAILAPRADALPKNSAVVILLSKRRRRFEGIRYFGGFLSRPDVGTRQGSVQCDDLRMPMDSGVMLPSALFAPGRYAVESSDALAAKVQAALKEKVEADVRPVPELRGLQTRDNVPPLGLLLGLGRLTSALPGLHRIGAGGLPGLSALRTASRWAIIRYLWAFSDRRPALELSDLTEQVRFHQRTLLSESFGIALAADLIERYILPGPTRVVDADAVGYDPVLNTDMADLASHKPDYFWYREIEGRLSEVVVVEVKGTTSGRTKSIEQLARGVEQVLVPARIHGVKMRRIVIGAELRNRTLRAYAVEVAEPEESDRLQAYEVVREREFRRSLEVSSLRTARFAAEADEEDAAAQALYLDQVRLHAFAGVPVSDESLRGGGELIRGVLDEREIVEADGLRFRCETTRMADGDRILAIRTGVAEEFLSSTDAYRSASSADRRGAYRQRRSNSGQAAVRGRSVQAETELSVMAAADGCMLSVSFDDR